MSTEVTTENKTKRTRKTAKTVKTAESSAQTVYTAKDIDMSQYITVKNGYPGTLIYTSKRTGEKFVWEYIGDEQDIELLELRNARNTSRKFFENNWFVFDDEYDWVIDFLGVRAYYNNIINYEGVDALFKMKPDEIRKELSSMTKGQKRTVAYRAMEMIREKQIDSISVIEVLEDELGIALIEK